MLSANPVSSSKMFLAAASKLLRSTSQPRDQNRTSFKSLKISKVAVKAVNEKNAVTPARESRSGRGQSHVSHQIAPP
jgi:hypothetical protein